MRIRRPKGEHKATCSFEGCTKEVDGKKDRYCKDHRNNYMRNYMQEYRKAKNQTKI